jgi:predicted phage baseplate assembly protein
MSERNMSDALDTCGCCEAPQVREIDNLPGLPAIAFRLGTHSAFLAEMKARIAAELPALTTRAADDPSIAMMDACATMCDVLAFYQERIANEGFLRTAVERRSVLSLARALGYELNPGVAAGTYLSFTVEDPPPIPAIPLLPGIPLPPPPILLPTTITIPIGTKVQSIPGQGELPQTFETLEAIEARTAWNAIRPRRFQRQQLSLEGGALVLRDPAGAGASSPCRSVWLQGTSTGLQAGDRLVLHITDDNIDASDPVSLGQGKGMIAAVVARIATDDVNKLTRVDLVGGATSAPRFGFPDLPDASIEIDPLDFTADNVRAKVLEQEWDQGNLAAFLEIQRWLETALAEQIGSLVARTPAAADVYAFRQRMGVFGHSAPPSKTLQAAPLDDSDNPIWPDFDASGGVSVWTNSSGTTYTEDDLYLERAVSGLKPGGLVGLIKPGDAAPTLYGVRAVEETSLADFAIAGKSTGLQLNHQADKTKPLDQWTTRIASKPSSFKMRKTTVHVQSEPLALALAPIAEPVAQAAVGANGAVTWAPASSLMLDRMVLGLAAGRVVSLSGATVDAAGNPTGSTGGELATLLKVTHTGGYTVLAFASPLANMYDRQTLLISANVVRASHGETQPVVPMAGNQALRVPGASREEILGSGDGSVPNPVFVLSRPPLTYVSAATPSGGQSTLTVRVNGVAWTEVPSLYGQAPTARVYTVRIEDDGTTSITFGDGLSGARVPTGRDNVTATYRSGIGADGEVDAGKLTLLMTRPPSVKHVINPIAASGSQDPEALEDARTNAPRTVRTFDRIVSLTDYEDFARGFAGVGKAQARPVWSGQTRVVHLTVASAAGEALDPQSDTSLNLRAGIAAAGDPTQPVQVDSFAPRPFRLAATIFCRPEYDCDEVLAEAQAAIEDAFTFEKRAFAQAVTDAEIMGIVHGVAGVLAVKITALYPAEQSTPSVVGVLAAAPARFDAATQTILPAELLLLQAAGLTLSSVAS